VLKQQLAYWEKKLGGVAESLDMATDYPRPSVQSFAGATHRFSLDAALTEQLKQVAERQGGTLYMVLLAAFQTLLYRYTGQSDICVGSPIANRQYGETEGLIGMFVNTLAMRSQVEGEQKFTDLLRQVKATCLEAYENQDTPFEKIVERLQPERNLAITPIFQVMLILQNADVGAFDRRFPPYRLQSEVSKFDFTATFLETPEGLRGSLTYNTSLYKPETIARMANHFDILCRAITAASTARVRELEFLGEAEEQQLLVGFNDTRADYPSDKCIHELFIEQVRINPDKTAVVFGGRKLSYRQLYDKSTDLALYLQAHAVKPDSIVGLCVERSLDMMVGIMGIVQAGGAYLPLDPDYPDERLAYMLEDSQAAIVLTQEKFANRISSLSGQSSRLISLDRQWPEVRNCVAALKEKNVELLREVKPHNLNYVIYTSGSTGKPKGVLVEHKALVNRIHWMQKTYHLSPTDIVLQKTPYSFDVSVWEFFWPMMAGAALVFAAPDGHKDVHYLEKLIIQTKTTTLHFVPSMLHTFLENAAAPCHTVKRIFCSGEALGKPSVDSYKTKFPNAVLHNLYGPTEAAIDVTAYDCSKLNYSFVPIGVPIDNTQIYVLDQFNHPKPIGVPGELHIAGDGLARGYLNRPELTQAKFVANPFRPGARMYKTGDLARWLDDGNIEFLGRNDHQVKIRGFRIELGEIEARLREDVLVREAVVVAREDEPGEKRLVAYVVLAKEEAHNSGSTEELANDVNGLAGRLRTQLSACLPEYMVPAAFVQLNALPLTSSGKLDRKSLPAPQGDAYAVNAYEAPEGDFEEMLASIWEEVLKIEKVGRRDNFFSLGGHSLMILRLVNRLEQKGINISAVDVFKHSTIESLAESLTATIEFQGKHASTERAICLRKGNSESPLFFTHDGSGQLIYVPMLAPYMDPAIPLYGLPAKHAFESQLQTIEEMATRMVQMIRAIQPTGPYRIAGWSFGGLTAYEVAAQLTAAGEEIEFLGLIDTYYLAPRRDSVDYQSDFNDKKDLLGAIKTIMRHLQVSEDQRLQAINDLNAVAANGDFAALVDKCRKMGLLPDRWVDLTAVQFRQSLARIHAHNLASARYCAPQITIPVHLFRAQEDDADSPWLGWNTVLPENQIRVTQVPGTHLTMMEKPNIELLGQVLSNAVRNVTENLEQWPGTGILTQLPSRPDQAGPPYFSAGSE